MGCPASPTVHPGGPVVKNLPVMKMSIRLRTEATMVAREMYQRLNTSLSITLEMMEIQMRVMLNTSKTT